MSLAIRRATEADAALLSSLSTACFIEAFGHLYEQDDLQAFLQEAHSLEAWQELLGNQQYATWVVEGAGEALGYATAGTCGLPHADVRAEDGELKRIYLRKQLQNGGWGGKLFQAAMDWLERDGPRTLWIGVWSQNLGAQRFYARHGFERGGEYEFPVGRVRDLEFILRRPARHA